GQAYDSLIQYVKDRPGHDRRYAMDITKISQELGWLPKQSLETGLLKTVKWYLDHPAWVEAIRSKTDYAGWMERNYANRGGQK
ncbi:MAG: dTDP-glucose 4,6-dehydratase, partial [Chloroflexi bacterium]